MTPVSTVPAENFLVQVVTNFAVIRCNVDIDQNHVDELLVILEGLHKQVEQDGLKSIIFDFERRAKLDSKALRKIAVPIKKISDSLAKVGAINVPKETQNVLRAEGMDRLIMIMDYHSPGTSSTKIIKASGIAAAAKTKSKPKLGPKHFVPLINAVVKTFNVHIGAVIVPTKPILRDKEKAPILDIGAVAEVKLDGFPGSIALCMSEKVFLIAASKMFNREITAISADVKDCAAELLNIILGQTRAALQGDGRIMVCGIPKATHPLNKTEQLTPTRSVVLPFTCENGEVQIEFGLQS